MQEQRKQQITTLQLFLQSREECKAYVKRGILISKNIQTSSMCGCTPLQTLMLWLSKKYKPLKSREDHFFVHYSMRSADWWSLEEFRWKIFFLEFLFPKILEKKRIFNRKMGCYMKMRAETLRVALLKNATRVARVARVACSATRRVATTCSNV